MYKLIFGAKRKPGMSREDFGRYWTTVHAEKAKKVPGISRYVINLAPTFRAAAASYPTTGSPKCGSRAKRPCVFRAARPKRT